jgi:hypothetical protein
VAAFDLLPLAYALGQCDGAMRFSAPAHRTIAALATVAEAWRAFRRDAGAGATGVAHAATLEAGAVLLTDDPRRDAMLLWLADNASPAIAAAAATVARMVGARRPFAPDALALLDMAQAALARSPGLGALAFVLKLDTMSAEHPLRMTLPVVGAIDTLLAHPDFAETAGHDALLDLPGTPLPHYVAAAPSGCWALNLAILCGPAGSAPLLPGPVPRAAFRLDVTAEERARALADHWTRVAQASVERLHRIDRRYARGMAALAGLSRNARARDAWGLIVGLGPLRRIHVARALGLSRAGADIQAHALAEAGLVSLVRGGRIQPAPRRPMPVADPLDDGPLAQARTGLDESLAEIDRLLARTAAAPVR